MFRDKSFIVLCAAAAVCGGSSLAQPASAQGGVTYTDLYTLQAPAGFSSVSPNGYRLTAGGQVVGLAYNSISDPSSYRAMLWNQSGVPTNLTPDGYSSSVAYGTNGLQQVGYAYGSGDSHAMLWNSNSTDYVDLNPSGFLSSFAYETDGVHQVGQGYGDKTNHQNHAMLWNSSSTDYIDLNPSVFPYSQAYGIGGGQEVGRVYDLTTSQYHALLWKNETAASYVDLNPTSAGFSDSYAIDTDGSQQVGYGSGSATGGSTVEHALLWTGSATGYVDLNPAGFTSSYAYGVAGGRQVGEALTADGGDYALLWNSSPDDFVNLQDVLPASFVSSVADSIIGNSVYGLATDTSGNVHAIVWTVPEPGSLAVLSAGALGLLIRRRRK